MIGNHCNIGAVTNLDVFESPKALLTWAYEDAKRFKELEVKFFEAEPYEHIVEFDEVFQRDAHRIRFTTTPPAEMRKLASHIVNDLRHSLDQAFYSAAKHFGWKPERKDRTLLYFPWSKNLRDLTNFRLKGIPEQIHKVIIDAQPYFAQDNDTGGDDIVRELGKIGGPNKHEAALASRGVVALNKLNVRWNADWRIPYDPWDPFKDELTLGYFPKDTEGDYDADVTFQIGFRDIKALNGRSCSDLFEYWGSYANHVVKELERKVIESGERHS